MTTRHDPLPQSTAATPPPVSDPITLRRTALESLDATVQPLLRARLLDSRPRSPLPPVLTLTVYDTVYRSTPAGGHWTVATRAPLLVGHQIASYTVTLEFDAAHKPARFQVSGAREVVSDDASLEALDRALTRAAAAGPVVTWAPNFMPGISL